jgi:hypothetical protein
LLFGCLVLVGQRAGQTATALVATVADVGPWRLPMFRARGLDLYRERAVTVVQRAVDVPIVVVGSKLGCTGHGDREAAEHEGKPLA